MGADCFAGWDRLVGQMLRVNREALLTARPWAWRRILDGLPPGPAPDPVARPGAPWNLVLSSGAGSVHLHSPTDPAGEAADIVRRAGAHRAQLIAVLGFGGGRIVEQALVHASAGASLLVLVVDPGSFLVTLAGRPVAAAIGDPRLSLAVGGLDELRAALPSPRLRPLWLVHEPLLGAVSPSCAPLVAQVREAALGADRVFRDSGGGLHVGAARAARGEDDL